MTHRNIPKMILFTIITLGIYQLFWLKWTRDEMVAKGSTIPRFGILIAPLLALLLALPLLLVAASDPSHSGDTVTAVGGVGFFMIMLGICIATPLIAFYWFYHYCYAVERATKGDISFGMSFFGLILLWIIGIPIIWPLLIQDRFNRLEKDHNPHSSTPDSPDKQGPILYTR